MRMTRENTMAIVVDYQEKLIPAMNDKEELIKTSAMFLEGLKILGIPMVVSQQYTKGLGGTVSEIKKALGEFEHHEKVSFSVYADDGKEKIDQLNRKNVLICGTEAHVCVLQTLIDLRAAGFNVFYVVDCVGSRSQSDKKQGIKRAMCEGAFITSAEAALFELTGGAASDAFKAISKLVK